MKKQHQKNYTITYIYSCPLKTCIKVIPETLLSKWTVVSELSSLFRNISLRTKVLPFHEFFEYKGGIEEVGGSVKSGQLLCGFSCQVKKNNKSKKVEGKIENRWVGWRFDDR